MKSLGPKNTFFERTRSKVRAPKFLAKKGLFSLTGSLKRKKTPFFWDFWYFVGSQEARKWQKFLPNPFFIDFKPKRTFLPNFTFLSFLHKKWEQKDKKKETSVASLFFWHQWLDFVVWYCYMAYSKGLWWVQTIFKKF